jgi:4-hydroxybenzoyl-CoA thioesterase
MIAYERPVRFEDVDAANIVFFARFLTYAHEAMENFFDAIGGKYVGLITKRRVGLPAVHVEVDFHLPLRYGDVVRIETSCERLGNKSAVLHYRMLRASDARLSAEVRHTIVTTDLETLKSCPMPDDVRRQLEQHPYTPGT